MTNPSTQNDREIKLVSTLDQDTILRLAQFGIGPAMAHSQVLSGLINTLMLNDILEVEKIYDRLNKMQGNFNPDAIEQTTDDQEYYRSLFIYTLRKSLFGDSRSALYPTKIAAQRRKRARGSKAKNVKRYR